jgi:glycolate oxidase
VEEDAAIIVELCRKHHAAEVRVAANDQEAARLRMARKGAFSSLARVRPTTILEDVTVPRSEVAPMLEKINLIARQNNVMIGNFGHAGDGNLHPTCLTDERDANEIQRVEKAIEEIFLQSVKFGGTISGEHGIGLAKRRFLEMTTSEPAIDMMRKIKASIDPNGVLNPGKVFTLKPRCEGPLPTNRDQIKKFLEMGAYT